MSSAGEGAHAASAGTSAIRRAHNGPAQVAQVAVCHARRAAAQIDRKGIPKVPPRARKRKMAASQRPDVAVFNHVYIHISV